MLTSRNPPTNGNEPLVGGDIEPVDRAGSRSRDSIRSLVLIVMFLAAMTFGLLGMSVVGACLAGATSAALLHEISFRYSRRWVSAGNQSFYAGIGTTLAIRFLVSLVLVFGYLFSGMPESLAFALSYGVAYVVAGLLEASELVRSKACAGTEPTGRS